MSFFNKRQENEIVNPEVQQVMPGLKEQANKLYRFGDRLDEEARANGGEIHANKQVEIDLTNYLVYLAIASNDVDQAEIEVLTNVLSVSLSQKAVVEMGYTFADYYTNEFGKTVPESFKMVSDYVAKRDGEEAAQKACQGLVEFYQKLGEALMNADYYAHPLQQERIEGYTKMLSEYLEEEVLEVA